MTRSISRGRAASLISPVCVTGLAVALALGAPPPAFAGGKHDLAVLHTLTGNEGEEPRAKLAVGADGALYGVAYWGGFSGLGTLFKQKPFGEFSVLHTFEGTEGSHPNSGLTAGPDGLLWGTTSEGGDFDQGTIFTIDAEGRYEVKYSFDWTNGGFVYPGVTFGNDGKIYGATTGGGPSGDGVLYRFDPATSAYTVLHAFTGTKRSGEGPYASLALASDGNFYGTTYRGGVGAGHKGMIFRMTPDGNVSHVHFFSRFGDEGCRPTGPLVQGPDGRMYGTAHGCGTRRYGTIFAFSLDGTFSVLWKFKKGECGIPWDGLTVGPDGLLHGTATYGGRYNMGCVYSISTTGRFKLEHVFRPDENTGQPKAGVTFIGQKEFGVTDSATWRLDKAAD